MMTIHKSLLIGIILKLLNTDRLQLTLIVVEEIKRNLMPFIKGQLDNQQLHYTDLELAVIRDKLC